MPIRLMLFLAIAATASPAVADQGAVRKGAQTMRPPCHSRADCDRRDYDYSGTRGRMGLGADPAHPEGPGNAPN
jgi:hypothetical protein